ncbi:serine hydrolase domain-containing protein [Helcococcus kunzii]|uniref:serine hydrolase domain-containing protein n=1 Tax=Helcococcus kunzii TaxID=40091 RepID=UPI0021A72532|nr:serine hydrolase domain-containing protein [Helcococcus kunzii]MCT1796863.1 beta-lactamase family protein [Helcococcus kunzii]MCT1989885.1 beta-lactamase family protein [Helcococcus kunzii]
MNKLERKLYEENFDTLCKKIYDTKDSSGSNLNVHYCTIKNYENIFTHAFNNFDGPCDIRSISKTIISIIVGIVKEKSKNEFNEDTFIYPIIKEKFKIINKDNLEKIKKIQVKHCLTHTIGYNEVLLMRDDIKDKDLFTLVNYLINFPIKYNPGEFYLYSNAGYYLLSVVLQEYLQEDLLIFIKREFFDKLDIKKIKWERYGDYIAGATRCWLYPEDLLKVGEVIMNQGLYDYKQIVSNEWLEYIKNQKWITKKVDTPGRIFRRYAYGSGLWLNKEKNIIFGHGTDCQLLITIPEIKTVIVVLSEQNEIEQLEWIIDDYIKSII